MLEHEHGDKPDYKFPVHVDFIGDITSLDEVDKQHIPYGEDHALIYTDGSVALTMYEYCYAMWYVRDGRLGGGSLWNEKQWKLSEEALAKIRAYVSEKETKSE